MSVTITEQLNSVSAKSSGGRVSFTRKFHVEGVTTIEDMESYFGAGTLPKLGDSFSSTFPGSIVKDFEINPVQGFSDLWEVTFNYEQTSSGLRLSGTTAYSKKQPNEVGYVQVTSNISAQFVEVWRENPDVNTVGIGNDIGGVKIDASGMPVSVPKRIQELTVTETVEVPSWGIYSTFVFSRNEGDFLGALSGRILYKGVNVRRTGVNVYQVSHHFVDDQFFHLVQTASRNAMGQVSPLEDGHAESVFHVQPFLARKRFQNISPNLAGLFLP